MASHILLYFLAFGFLFLGILCFKTAIQKVSYMEKLKRKGVQSARNYGRGFFLLLSLVLIFCSIKLLISIN